MISSILCFFVGSTAGAQPFRQKCSRGIRGYRPNKGAWCATGIACRILKTHYLWRYCSKKAVMYVKFTYNNEFERTKIRDNCGNIYCYHKTMFIEWMNLITHNMCIRRKMNLITIKGFRHTYWLLLFSKKCDILYTVVYRSLFV